MRKRDVILLWVMGAVVGFELLALSFLVYFSALPFFLFIFIAVLKLFSFFLIGLIAIFLTLTIFGRKPEAILKNWFDSVKDSFKFFGTSLLLTILMAIICVLLGALIAVLLKRLYCTSSIYQFVGVIRGWIEARLY